MEPSRPSLLSLSRRVLVSAGFLVFSYRYDLIAAYINVVLPWVFSLWEAIGLVSVLWLLLIGPVRMDYDRVLAVRNRFVTSFFAQLYLWIAIHGFWLLQSLDLLVDAYPTGQPIHREKDEPTIHHQRVG